NSTARSTASRSDNRPEKGIFVTLEVLPLKGPCTCTVGLMVLMLLVVPGIAVCVAVTEPPCGLRPESGNWTGCAGCGCVPLAGICARTFGVKSKNKNTTLRTTLKY